MLFPLIESCLPEDLIRVWQRVGRRVKATEPGEDMDSAQSLEVSLKDLMHFLKIEVENEQRISLASEGFGLTSSSSLSQKRAKQVATEPLPTAVGLVNCDGSKCLFCDGSHSSDTCLKAQKFPLDHKKDILTKKRACFRWLWRSNCAYYWTSQSQNNGILTVLSISHLNVELKEGQCVARGISSEQACPEVPVTPLSLTPDESARLNNLLEKYKNFWSGYWNLRRRNKKLDVFHETPNYYTFLDTRFANQVGTFRRRVLEQVKYEDVLSSG
ncbi:hypothetical protein NQ318_009349 [Aromia moschata]|uniref:Uncharacterized protein n=1 Tax=Aromia moschata TaxID=1265417 RepID=A0AAV8X494_9CUCU|nr:hypothetical protein NQ318_009349 [Aromia moschata]